MKKIATFIFMLSITLLANISVSSPTNIYAEEGKADNSILTEEIQKEMESFINSTELNLDIEDYGVSLRDDIDMSQYTEAEIADLLNTDIELMKKQLLSTEYSLTSLNSLNLAQEITPFLVNEGGGHYTAEVWAGLPAIGSSTVKQDFRAVVSNGRVTSVTLLGPGYMTGLSWGQYNHIRSWHQYFDNSRKVRIYIKGNINYTFNLINNNYSATFIEYLKVSGNSLVRDLSL